MSVSLYLFCVLVQDSNSILFNCSQFTLHFVNYSALFLHFPLLFIFVFVVSCTLSFAFNLHMLITLYFYFQVFFVDFCFNF
uniref:Uncharacterized protein n=1 Tax=Psorophora albipes TaxID=869069 RepID=T1E2U9_9DIPT